VSVAQVLLHRDTDFSTLLELLRGERIHVGGRLKEIGWPDSQSDIYALLSRMAHPSRTSAFLGRTLDFESEPLKSLVAREDITGVARVILWQGARENEEAQAERWGIRCPQHVRCSLIVPFHSLRRACVRAGLVAVTMQARL